MSSYVADTHALLWHLSADPSLSLPAVTLFRQADAGEVEIVVPSIVLVEIIYLSERQRVPGDRIELILSLVSAEGGPYRVAELDEAIVRALRRIPRADVPDLPDRVIGRHRSAPPDPSDHPRQATQRLPPAPPYLVALRASS